jgi:hypothetical protein
LVSFAVDFQPDKPPLPLFSQRKLAGTGWVMRCGVYRRQQRGWPMGVLFCEPSLDKVASRQRPGIMQAFPYYGTNFSVASAPGFSKVTKSPRFVRYITDAGGLLR